VPTDGQHQHLVRGNTAYARQPKTHELALRQQLGQRRRHAAIVAAIFSRPWDWHRLVPIGKSQEVI
jgi:hypothetical protein